MELECKKDELREMIDMIESEETVDRVGKYSNRDPLAIYYRGTERAFGRG